MPRLGLPELPPELQLFDTGERVVINNKRYKIYVMDRDWSQRKDFYSQKELNRVFREQLKQMSPDERWAAILSKKGERNGKKG